MDISKLVAKARCAYHTNRIDLVNAGNQLGLIKNEKADQLNKESVMMLVNDILPRIYGREAVNKLVE